VISVIVYGRNDAHGYNLHKRAAISLNCISEILTDPDDEIIFVDCNTPNDMPTFPEAIADTLTQKTKSMLRVLRIRPEFFAENSRQSSLAVNEPLSRNVGLRRSNNANKWVLSTNPDMIFVPQPPWNSLSEITRDLVTGYYGTCRIDIPESLWETMDRSEPNRNIRMLSRWGQRLHINEVVYLNGANIFDGPGDFQLMPREQLMAINGFDERMVHGWHVDSNISKRMHLLFGITNSLLENVFGYHCAHTRMASFAHTTSVRTSNDWSIFVDAVTEPAASEQDQWGLADTEIEEISLESVHNRSLVKILEDILPGMSEPYLESYYTGSSYDALDYDTEHVFPYLVNYFTTTPIAWNIAYHGANTHLLRLLSDFLLQYQFTGRILVQEDLMAFEENSEEILPAACIMATQKECSENCLILVFDAGIQHFSVYRDKAKNRAHVPPRVWAEKMLDSFLSSALQESIRIRQCPPRNFILIGAANSWFEGLTSLCVDHIHTPYCSHIRHGFIRPDLDFQSIHKEKDYFTFVNKTFEEVLKFADKHIGADATGLVPDRHEYCEVPLKQSCYIYRDISEWKDDIRFAIVFKGDFATLKPWLIERIKQEMRPVYANSMFVCFFNGPGLKPLEESYVHFNIDVYRRNAVDFVIPYLTPASRVLVAIDPGLMWLLADRHILVNALTQWSDTIKWAIIFNGDFTKIQPWLIERIKKKMAPVFANEIFICFSSDPKVQNLLRTSSEVLWRRLKFHDMLKRMSNRVSSVLTQHPQSWWTRPAHSVLRLLRKLYRRTRLYGLR
jgi:hypothetical protein